jgi:hypothetical protein
MNLNEQISRMKSMMGIIVEKVDSGCKVKHTDFNPVEIFWEDKTKTEDQKIKEIENFVKPFMVSAIDYYSKYVESEWFNKKVQEKINSSHGALITTWGDKEKNDLKTFIKNLKLIFNANCESGVLGYVQGESYDTVNFCAKEISPNQIYASEVNQLLIHEISHSLGFYFAIKKVKFMPKNAKGPNVSKFLGRGYGQYGNDAWENAARIQTLKNMLNVDDFGTIDSFVKLIKDNLKIKHTKLPKPDYKIENNSIKINVNNISDKKEKSVLSFDFFIKDIAMDTDLALLFNTASSKVVENNEEYTVIDLSKIYNYTQEFAKINNNNQTNYA